MEDAQKSEEEFIISKIITSLSENPTDAKCWLIAAKTLYPHSFNVQYQAYQIEKEAGNASDAARTLGEIFSKFRNQPQLWIEIDAMALALRQDILPPIDAAQRFLYDIFQDIPLNIQYQILFDAAERCEDTMEYCRLLLLLMERFPDSVSKNGLTLIERLITAEKHSYGNKPLNPYRKMLVCELLPLIGKASTPEGLTTKLLYKLLDKSVQFYVSSILETPDEKEILNKWNRLASIVEVTGDILEWDLEFVQTFRKASWNKVACWRAILKFRNEHEVNFGSDIVLKQLLYPLVIFFLFCLHEYNVKYIDKDEMVLVEAFTELNYNQQAKRLKFDEDVLIPIMTVDDAESAIIDTFQHAVGCWNLLHMHENIKKDYLRVITNINIDHWINNFVMDFKTYKGHYEEITQQIMLTQPEPNFQLNLCIASVTFFQRQSARCFEQIQTIIKSLQQLPSSGYSENLTVTTISPRRHVHYLSLTKHKVLQYCVRMLITGIKDNITKHDGNDLSLGNLMVLIQLDWPQCSDIISIIIDTIIKKRSFHYPLLQAYVINDDILEELMYLWNNDVNGKYLLDIFLKPPTGSSNQRRISTRGSDKGVKEDFRQAMRKQIMRYDDPIDQLMISFLTDEKNNLLQSFYVIRND